MTSLRPNIMLFAFRGGSGGITPSAESHLMRKRRAGKDSGRFVAETEAIEKVAESFVSLCFIKLVDSPLKDADLSRICLS